LNYTIPTGSVNLLHSNASKKHVLLNTHWIGSAPAIYPDSFLCTDEASSTTTHWAGKASQWHMQVVEVTSIYTGRW